MRFADRHAPFDHCRGVLPWFQFAYSPEPMARLRKLILRLENETAGLPPPNRFIAFFVHVPVSLRQMWIVWRQHGKLARENFRVGHLRQFADLLYLSWRLNHSPHDYYRQKMWLRSDRRTWTQYLNHREHVAFVKQLERTLPIKEFDDKLQFFRRMKAGGVPTIEVLLAATGGRWLEEFSPNLTTGCLQQDLVIKPTDGAMHDGVETWFYDRQTELYTRPSSRLKKNGRTHWIPDQKHALAGLLDLVLKLSEKRTYIVQGRLKNFPPLEPISPHWIANFRIVTAQRPGEVRVIAAFIRMGHDIRKFIPGTYQANVDLETGTLGIATGGHPQWGFGETHVETGARVTGTRIEHWPQLKAIAIRGHEQYPWMPTIGWDAIDTEHGPMLMEANAFWGADIAQVDVPFLGEAGYAEACLEAYEREERKKQSSPIPAGREG